MRSFMSQFLMLKTLKIINPCRNEGKLFGKTWKASSKSRKFFGKVQKLESFSKKSKNLLKTQKVYQKSRKTSLKSWKVFAKVRRPQKTLRMISEKIENLRKRQESSKKFGIVSNHSSNETITLKFPTWKLQDKK